ncbi:MAG: CHAT domain-containing protein [Candidatus Rokubacteria bacterium]|nr:CHAT domain-containing protein [Candidatus Rokubacteria bacterium]
MRRLLIGALAALCLALAVASDHGIRRTAEAQNQERLQRARELNTEALQHLRDWKHAEGLPKAREALAIRDQELGPRHPDVAESLQTLADLLRDSGDYAAARPLLERALRIREQAFGATHPWVAHSLDALGHLLYVTGDYRAARPLLERALTLREQALGPTHPVVAVSLTDLALVLSATGNLAGATALHERALQIRERALGPNHPGVAASLHDLGELRREGGDYAAARRLHERALRIREQAFGPSHPGVARSLHALGAVLLLTGDYAAARPLFERALQIRQQALGPKHPAVAATLADLARLVRISGDSARARTLSEQALQIREQSLGPTHPWIGWSLNNLASILRATGDLAGARPLFERALSIARGASVPELRWRAAWSLGGLHEREGRPREALPLYREAVATLSELAGQFEAEETRTQYLQGESRLGVYDALARLLLRLHEEDRTQGYDREAWALLQAKKGRVIAEALAGARPEPQNPKARQAVEDVQARQDQLLALEQALREEQAKAPQEQQAERLQNLTTLLAQTKADYLAQVQGFLAQYPQYKSSFVDQQTVDPKALAKFAGRLPAGTLVVQYFAAPDALYLFVVAPGGVFRVKSQAVSQAELYDEIKQYRHHLERAASQRLPWADDGSDAYRRDVAPLKALTGKLAAHLLGPIEAELEAHRELILIPNDLLLYLPIHALTRRLPDGSVRFLAETHAVSYLTQLELVDLLNPAPPTPNAPLLALANPDGSLPGASREVRALVRVRPAVTTLDGSQATKERFLALASQFPHLHLATHGVLDPQRPERSYLLMAGADEASQRLGIREIAGLNLRNGLAVLSACDTALGEQVPGAALITLAAAFSQAGAESIVASLWEVNDAATRDFMVAFHGALARTGRAAAFQQAQLAVLRNPATAHPYYWAPFILIGAR